LSASGTSPAMQRTQLAFTKNYLDQQRSKSIEAHGQKVAIDELITSERGNGLLFDRSVNAGMGGARKTLTAVVDKYLDKHPEAKLSDETVRAEIETAYIAAVSKSQPERSAHVAARTSATRGSYVE
jgi:hypothetical protein